MSGEPPQASIGDSFLPFRYRRIRDVLDLRNLRLPKEVAQRFDTWLALFRFPDNGQ